MRSTIAINNALRYYGQANLVSDSQSYKEKLSEDISVTAYNRILGNICSKHFVSKHFLSNF